jgi:phosphate transport system protein
MGSLVQSAARQSADALLSRDPHIVQSVWDAETQIDAEEVEIERQAINLLALHQPAAGDLRSVFAIVKINTNLERIADCCVNIAQQVGAVAASGVELPHDIRAMADAVLRQIDDALLCMQNKDSELADRICKADDAIDALYNQVLHDLQAGMQLDRQNITGDVALIFAAKNFERIGDHCTNIAEDVVYRLRGTIVRHSHDPR